MAADLDEGQLRERLAAKEDEVSRFEMQMGELEARFVEVTTQLDATTKARSIAEADAEAQREARASAPNRRWLACARCRPLHALLGRIPRSPAGADRPERLAAGSERGWKGEEGGGDALRSLAAGPRCCAARALASSFPSALVAGPRRRLRRWPTPCPLVTNRPAEGAGSAAPLSGARGLRL